MLGPRAGRSSRPASMLAASLKAARAAGRAARAAARRPARRAAVREAVAAHALDVHDRRARARRRRDRAAADVALGGRESIEDVARNLERWVFGVVVRTFAQERLEAFAAAAPRLRVVNALTDEEHPCQALADCLTLIERWGTLRGPDDRLRRRRQQRRGVAGAGRAMLGGNVRLALAARATSCRARRAQSIARGAASRRRDRHRPTIRSRRSRGADAVYTDVWASMGQEAETRQRAAPSSRPIRSTSALMAHAAGGRDVHALPAGAPRRRSDRRGHRLATRRSSSTSPRTACTRRRRCWRCSPAERSSARHDAARNATANARTGG